jgi:transcriptional regulator with XRE-family HTH domain
MPRVSSRNPDKDPSAALGEHLRRVRLAAGYQIQDAFAAAIHISQDQVSRAETGNQPPMEDVFARWMDLCHVTGAELEMFKTMFKLAWASHQSKGVAEFARPWYEAEAEAEFIDIWDAGIVPGLFQTQEYAEAMFDLPGIDKDWAAETVAFRMQRQAILHTDDPVHVSCVLHESVLYLEMGSPAAMVRQLDHMLAMSLLPNVTLHIARGKGSYWGLAGPFQIASAHEKPDTVVMPAVEDQTSVDPALIRKAAILFQKIRGNALNLEDSRVAMTEAREHWNTHQQAQAGASPATAITAE